MTKRSSFGVRRVLGVVALLPLFALTGSACTARTAEADGSSADALSESECTKVVEAAVAKSLSDCALKTTQVDAAAAERKKLESDILDASTAFERELQAYQGKDPAVVAKVVAECSAVQCAGKLKRGSVKASCDVERASLQTACFVRHQSELAATDVSLTQLDGLTAADAQWEPLATKEGWLRLQVEVCSAYAGSTVQKVKLNRTCRASCNDADPTSVLGVFTGQGSSCMPPGFEEVKDDLGNVVQCGAYERPLWNVGTVCECHPQDACFQFAALAISKEHGQPCDSGRVKQLVWNAATRTARLDCR